ncbi:aromatic amino acid DMT transporter YddG [Vibrio algivorus]|uniref:Drug/metabolite DMT transporter permease n=1 Tax=Vibrio algivorus TaxID=1667024 RepID=A0A557NY79_9VIBR|nr:aromatic amino acid DMT transporter YddG [Vibrio algivorus]TVO33366.1 drug/metabolite DMT transporter permease [Vibrio algivorus]
MSFLTKHKYTLCGILAILLWSSLTALIRDISELFSPTAGAAMIYSVSTVFLFVVMGVPRLKQFPKQYLIVGGILFVIYEICLALSLGLANSRRQSMEMAIINYLWPALTILLSVIVSNKKVNPLLYPSIALAFIGVAWCISGEQPLSIALISQNVIGNPIPYLLAFSGALIWAVYCTITKKMSDGQNPISLFFMATATSLWIKYAMGSEPSLTFTWESSVTVLIAGITIGSGYALWNHAIVGGNIILLGTLSYFIPIFATLFSVVYLEVSLSHSFWQGVALVTFASLMCFFITREKRSKPLPTQNA